MAKKLKESYENYRVKISSNEDFVSFIRPMQYGISAVQLMSMGRSWGLLNKPTVNCSGYTYFNTKDGEIQFSAEDVVKMDVDDSNKEIYFYSNNDALMIHFYNLSDEDWVTLVYGDEYLDGLVTRFGK